MYYRKVSYCKIDTVTVPGTAEKMTQKKMEVRVITKEKMKVKRRLEDEKEETKEDKADDFYYEDNLESSVVQCETSAGNFAIEFRKAWSPIGYERAIELFKRGFYDNSHFFRVVPDFLVQFGISYTKDEALQNFARQPIKDDPQMVPKIEFDEGIVSFAGSGKDSRTSHLFVAYGRNSNLGTQLWETPVGVVIEGMDTLLKLNHEYGDMPPWGHGPEQHKINSLGESYIEAEFPHLDKFLTCEVITGHRAQEEHDDGGRNDDFINIDAENVEVAVKGLRKTKTRKIEEKDIVTSRGFEIPIFFAAAFSIVIIVGLKKRARRKLSKSL